MPNTTDNYCQILGLDPFNESKYTEQAIKEKIDKLEDKWSNEHTAGQNDPGTRFRYGKMLKMIPDMRERMSDPVLRKGVFAEGRKDLEGKCQGLRMNCLVLTDGTCVLQSGALTDFMKKLRWQNITEDRVRSLSNITASKVPKPIDDQVGNTFDKLRTVDAYTPADVLNELINNPDLDIKCNPLTDGSSMSQLRNAFELCEARVNNVRADLLPDRDTYISVIRGLKLIIDSDKNMEDLINYGKCYRAMEPAMEVIDRERTKKQLTRKYVDDLLSIYARDLDTNLCTLILEDYCQRRGILANFSDMDTTMTRCPGCGSMVAGGSSTLYCPYCGKAFKMVCPRCETAQQTGNTVCISCGFNFKEGESKAQACALNFRMDLQKGMVLRAEKDLNQLKSIYANYQGIVLMENDLTSAKNSMNSLKKLFSESYQHQKYYSAKDAGDHIASGFPEVMNLDPELKQKYQDACTRVNTADSYCEKAAAIQVKADMLAMYVNAMDACPDHPRAKAVLQEYPPMGPADPSGTLEDGHLTLRFEAPSESKGLTYVVFREKNTMPAVTETSRPIAEIPIPTYVDKMMEPGVEYYYSVYSKRWGILSKEGAYFGPAVTMSEVNDVTIEHIDGGLRLIFEKPRGASRVLVWRNDDTEGGISVEIPVGNENVYDDVGLKGGLQYHYLFVAEYRTRNGTERSKGVVKNATPLDAPEPIRNMAVVWNKDDGTYTAKWSSDSPVVLYRSEKRYKFLGNLLKLEEIQNCMVQIKPTQTYNEGARFYLPDGTVQYIYPIIVLGKMCVKGNEVMVANVKPFRDVERTIVNKDCILTMNWPDNAVMAKLVISNSGVKDIKDPNAEIMTVRREEYNVDKMIRIPMGKAQKKCINIFAIYKIDNETLTSRGVATEVYSAQCRKVRYEIRIERGGAELSITADPEEKALPAIGIVHVEEGIPLRREDGEIIWSSEGVLRLDGGRYSARIDLKGLTDAEHMRIFFKNEQDYHIYRFIHPLYGTRS